MTTPYTYLIGWPNLNTWYYGVRWRPNCHPSDLWTKYFTSSKYVKTFREKHGEPSVVQIRRIFSAPDKARAWEHRVLARIKADVNPLFLNKTINNVPTMLGRKHSDETKQKIRESNIGVKRSQSTCSNIRTAQLKRIENGYSDSAETRIKKSLSHRGIAKSSDCRKVLSQMRLGSFWWTNGVASCAAKECPGEGWVRGRMSYKTNKGSQGSL